jgi:hypothetical protein
MFIQTAEGEPLPPLAITSRSTVHVTQPFQVTVTSNDTPVENASVTFLGMTQRTDSEGHAFFTAPNITSLVNTTCTINASKEGYEPATTTITIVHVPKLLVNISQNGRIIEGEKFIVTVFDEDNHQIVQNVTVIFNGKEYRTTTEGIVTITAPHRANEGANYMIVAEKPGYRDSTPQIIHILSQPHGDYSLLFGPLLLIILVVFIVIVAVYDKLKNK